MDNKVTKRGIPMRERWETDNQIWYKIFLHDRVIAMILGGVIGDALGVPVEFKDRDTFTINGMTGHGTYNQPKGTWSDDTSLTMCLIENIIESNDEKGLLDKFVKYMEEGYWTPNGEMFDIGIATKNAIDRYRSGVQPQECGGNNEYDNGNGALMRISPLVPLLYRNFDVASKEEVIEKICSLTHRHTRSNLACIFYIQFLIMIINNNTKEKSYEGAVNICLNHLKIEKYNIEYANFKRILENKIYEYKKDQIYSDGYVVHSLEAALWCFFKHDNYKDIVLEAVNLGGDTDTIASIAGTMAGLYYKMDGIPVEWLAEVTNIEKVKGKLEEFCLHLIERKYDLKLDSN